MMVRAVYKLIIAMGPAQARAACGGRGCFRCCTAGLHRWVKLTPGCMCGWLEPSQFEALHSRTCPE